MQHLAGVFQWLAATTTELSFATGPSLPVSYKSAAIVSIHTSLLVFFLLKPTVIEPTGSDIGVITAGFSQKP